MISWFLLAYHTSSVVKKIFLDNSHFQKLRYHHLCPSQLCHYCGLRVASHLTLIMKYHQVIVIQSFKILSPSKIGLSSVSVVMSLWNCGGFSSNIQESSSDYIIISLKSHLQKLSDYHLWPLQQCHFGLPVHSHLSYKQCNTIVINSEVTPSEAEHDSFTFVSLWVPSCLSS